MISIVKSKKSIYLIVVLILLAISLIGSSAWLIVPRVQKEASLPEEPVSHPCFVSEAIYSGNAVVPSLNELGEYLLGTTASRYTAEYIEGPFPYGSAAGTHYYKIIDTVTGEVISERHAVVIKPDPIIITSSSVVTATPPSDIGGSSTQVTNPSVVFVGDKITLNVSLQGQNSGTNSGSASVDYVIRAEDYTPSATLGCPEPTVTVDISSLSLGSNYDNTQPASCKLTNITVLPKCYTTTTVSTDKIYYGDIEQALDATAIENASGTAVVAMQSLAYVNTTYSASTLAEAGRFTHSIKKSVTIASNVTLNIPYDVNGSLDGENPSKDNATIYVPTCTNVVSVGEYSSDGKLIGDNIVITNNGGIYVGGILGVTTQSSSDKASNPPAGVTSSLYSIFAMGSNAVLNCGSSSSLNVRGYLTAPAYVSSGATEEERANADNGAKINVAAGGTVTMPFIVYDYHGGSHVSTTYTKGEISPFSVYDMPNVHAQINYKAGSKLVGIANMYAGDKYNVSPTTILSKSGALLNLTSGDATFKYTPTQLDQFGTSIENSRPHMDAKTKIVFRGNMSTGSLSLKVSIDLEIITTEQKADMSTVICPISHKFDLTFSGSATYSITSSYKIMPSASVTVDTGATVGLTNSSSVIFYTDGIYSDSVDLSAHIPWQLNSKYREGAKFVLNGTLNVPSGCSFAADVTSTVVGAKLNLSSGGLSVSSKEGYGSGNPLTGSYVNVYTETGNMRGVIVSKSGSGFTSASGNMSNLVYVSAQYSSGAFGWLNASTSFDLNYVHVGAGGQTITNSNPTTYTPATSEIVLSTPTAGAGLNFAGWFTDSACSPDKQVTVTDGITLFAQSGGNATLYAKWVPVSYSVSFNTSVDSGNVSVGIANMYVESGDMFNPYNNVQIKGLVEKYRFNYEYNRYFDGWYTSSTFDESTRVDEENGIRITANTTLYVKWGVKYKITFNIPTGKNINYTISDVWLAPGDTIAPYLHNTTHTDYDNDVTFRYYFDAWYFDSSFKNKIDADAEYVMTASNVTFYANWLEKLTITVKCNTYSAGWLGGGTQNVVGNFTVNGEVEVSMGGSFYLRPEQNCTISITAKDTLLGSDAKLTSVTATAGTFLESTVGSKEATATFVAPLSGSVTINVQGQKA